MTGAAPLLEIQKLCAGYGEIEVLHRIDLSMNEGEFVCIIGANTAGKSTILRCISRLVPRVTGAGGTSGTSGDDWFTFGTPTTTTLDADQWTVYPNETATLSAIVDPIPNDGTVTFADGSGPLCQDVAVDPGSGIATCPVSYPSAGPCRPPTQAAPPPRSLTGSNSVALSERP